MIRLVYSNRTEELLSALAEALRERRRAGAHPLEPVHLLVPNRNLEQHVRLGLAERLGVAANLRFRRLQRFVAELVREADPSARLVDAEALRGGLLAIFHDASALADLELQPVREYLAASDDDARALRAVQLATRLSRLFEEYAYSRPAMLARWPQRATIADGFLVPLERWQRALWLALVGASGWLSRHPPGRDEGGRWVQLADVAGDGIALAAGQPPLYVFGVSYVAAAFQQLFHRLAQQREVSLFTLNPCREFWEDVETPREHRRRMRAQRVVPPSADDPFGLFADTDNRPLQWWGRPGREHVGLLSELTECEFEERFRAPDEDGLGPPTLLETVQGDVLRRAPTVDRAPREAWAHDGSVRVLAAPDLRREVEAVADAIWQAMREPADRWEPLRWSDVAVIVNAGARDRYLPQVQAVFAEYHGIPCTVGDLPFAGERRVGEAAQLLLELPFGRMTRADLLRVMLHPAVRGRFPDVDPDEWARLAAELGIFRGASHADLAGTYVEEDLLSWDQGLRRLALGAFLTGARSGDDRLWEAEGREVRAADLPTSRLQPATQFALLARSLLADARRIRDERLPLSTWATALRALLGAYLAPGEDEEGDLTRCLGAVGALERADVGGVPVAGRVACELAREAIADLFTGRSAATGIGVVVSTLLPMRAIPFRVVFVLGLGEGEFPAANRRDALDLRAAGRQAGDVTPAERDRYLFLETLLSARERLVLSYVARDERTGETLRPSSVVQELLDVLARSYVGNDGVAALRTEVPPQRWHPRYFAGDGALATVAPGARAEAAADQLGDELRAAAPAAPVDPLPLLRRDLDAASWRRLGAFLRLPDIAGAQRPGEPTTASPPMIPASRLRELLECPLQASARWTLELEREDPENAAEVEDEPFRSSPRAATMLVRDALALALRGGGDAPRVYRDLARPRTLAGELPAGVLGELERELHMEQLAEWQATLHRLGLGGGERLRFGRAGERDDIDLLVPAIAVAAADGQLVGELHGRSELLLDHRRASAIADLGGGRDPRMERTVRELRLTLRGFFDHLLLAASDLQPDVERRVVLLRRDAGEERCVVRPLGAISAADARSYLALLAGELRGGVHDYLLPCEAVFAAYAIAKEDFRAIDPVVVARDAVDRIGAPRKDCASRYGPVPAPETYLPPSRERIEAILGERWLPFFRLLGEAAVNPMPLEAAS